MRRFPARPAAPGRAARQRSKANKDGPAVRCAPGPLSLKGAARAGHQRHTYPLRSGQKPAWPGARGGRSPETVPIQSGSLELFIAISVACCDIWPAPLAAAPRLHLEIRAALRKIASFQSPGAGLVVKPARRAPPCCGWPASWSISPSRGRKNSRVTRLCARTWLEFRAAALKSRPAGDPADKGSPRIQTVAFCRTLDWDSPLGPRLTIAPTPAGLIGITGESPPARLLHARVGRAPRPPGSSRRPGGKRPASRPLGGSPPKRRSQVRTLSHKVIFLGQGTPARRGAVRRRTGKDPPARLLLPGGLTQERKRLHFLH